MAAPLPKLHLFAISHYCEKARWALDHLGIEYTPSPLAPGLHQFKAKALGAKGSSLPILELGPKHCIQGSSAIIDWAEGNTLHSGRSLALDSAPADVNAIERRLDRVLGVHVRRHYYSEAIVDHPETVLPLFVKELSFGKSAMTKAVWPILRRLMIQHIDLGPEQRLDSRSILEAELNWLDGFVRDGETFLFGERISRVDISAASLLAPLVQPAKHPVYADLQVPPGIQEDYAGFAEHPILRWCKDLYARFR